MNTQPESTNPLTCPDSNKYYLWKGTLPTSAHYYINNQGVPVENACTWAADGTNMGNWAPSTLGVHQDPDGRTWLQVGSSKQNNPTSSTSLNYTITIEGDLGNKCRYSNGKYCIGDNYDQCNESWCLVSSSFFLTSMPNTYFNLVRASEWPGNLRFVGLNSLESASTE